MKDKVTITVDSEVWALFGAKFSNKSGALNEFMKKAVNWTDKEEECLERIKKLQYELDREKDNLCRIREQKKIIAKENGGYDEAVNLLLRMHEVHGVIGLNRIKEIANNRGLNNDVLVQKLKEKELNIVNVWIEPNEKEKSSRDVFQG